MEDKNLPAPQEKQMVYEMANGEQMTLTMNTVRKYLVSGHANLVTDSEILYYMHECKARKLNPFLKQCWLIKYSQKDNAQIVESIHHKRAKARRAEDCKGWEKGLILVDKDGKIKRSNGLVLPEEKLVGAWFSATPEGWSTPYELEINLNGYVKKRQDGNETSFWSKEKQPSQIMKVAESQGLSALWGDTIGNTYIPEELPSVDMFAGENGTYEKPEEAVDTSAFDKLTSDVKNKEDLEAFLEVTAKIYSTSVDVIKSQGAGDFKKFMESFDTWIKNNKKPGKEPVKEEEEPANWWANENHWKFLGGDRFVSALKNHADDFEVAGKTIRNAVWKKWIAKNDQDDWPLKPEKPESIVVEEEPKKDRPQLGGEPDHTARNSEDFKKDDPEKDELGALKEELNGLKANPETADFVQKAAENLGASISPLTLDGHFSLIEETKALMGIGKM